jgi:hypothetical protein
VSNYRKFEKLRWKLANGESMNSDEATGNSVAKMVKEIEQTGNLQNLYCLEAAEVEQRIVKLRLQMTNIKTRIKTMWKLSPPVEFKKLAVTATDLAGLS